MISKAPIGDDARALISPALFMKLGRLCFTQLLELRHRGAFSTVSQTFAAFCRRCVSSNIATLRALPDVWYEVSWDKYKHRLQLTHCRKLFGQYKTKLVPLLADLLVFQRSWLASWLQTPASSLLVL
jgi:hypothetical protein